MAGAAFEPHIRQQLPFYDLATRLTCDLVRAYLPRSGVIYDLGCATGNIGRQLGPLLAARDGQLIAVDSNRLMLEHYIEPDESNRVAFKQIALENCDLEPCDVIISFLTIQFLAVQDRKTLIQRILAALRPGGVFLLVERFEPESGYPALALERAHFAAKLALGADPEDILRKEVSLIGVQRPLNRAEIPSSATEYFRFGDFAGFLIESPN